MVESYMIDVSSPQWLVQKGIKVFGSFPQNTCEGDSKANAAIDCGDGSTCTACELWDADVDVCTEKRHSVFPINKMMMRAVNWNIALRVASS